MRPLVEELGRRGNLVVVVFPEVNVSMGAAQHTTTLTYPVPYTKNQLQESMNSGINEMLSADVSTDMDRFQSFINTMDILKVIITRNAEGLLSNKNLMKKLQDYNFDAILTDPFEPVGIIAAEYLSVPAIYMQTSHPCGADALASQCPIPASYVPQPLTHFTDHMNLWQRSVNLVRTLLQPMACGRMFARADEIASRVLQKKTSMVEIMSRAALWFMHFDFAFEVPRPLMPNMIIIGGMDSKKAGPLSQLCLFCLGSAEAGKLLVVPSDGSHWTGMRPLVEELGRRGNQVVVVIPEASLSMGPSQHTTTLTYPVPYTKTQLQEQVNAGVSTLISKDLSTDLARFQSFHNTMDLLNFLITRNAEGLLSNEALMKKLQDYSFDAILTDPFEPTGAIAGEYLSVPAIYIQTSHPCGADALASQCPIPASYVPQPLTHFTDHMNLWQRSVNLVRTLLQPMDCGRMFARADEIASRVLQKKTSMVEILSRAALWFMHSDFVLLFPRPLMPNMIVVGGMDSKGSAEAGKLLVIPSDGSHWLGMKPIVEELGRRGNQVVVVIPEASLSMGPSQNTTTLTYPVNYTKAELEADLADQLKTVLSIDSSTDLAKFQVFIISLDLLQSFIVRNAEGLLFNKDLMNELQDYSFDAILTDPFEPTGAIAGEYLSIPAIYMQINLPCGVDALASQCPVPASYVPQPLTHFTDRMNLWQRSVNLIRTLLQPMACRHLFTRADEIASRVLERKASIVEIMSRAALWFMRFDFALELPRPLMPNMVMIGGMATKKPKPLSQVSFHNYICMQLHVHLH
ncbi:hypothetical protein PO909_033547 [Leuciscus waleckii]